MSQSPSPPAPIITSMETVEIEFSAKVFTGFQLFYGVPSFIIMSVLFLHLGSRKHYTNSFYRLVQVDLLTVCFFLSFLEK